MRILFILGGFLALASASHSKGISKELALERFRKEFTAFTRDHDKLLETRWNTLYSRDIRGNSGWDRYLYVTYSGTVQELSTGTQEIVSPIWIMYYMGLYCQKKGIALPGGDKTWEMAKEWKVYAIRKRSSKEPILVPGWHVLKMVGSWIDDRVYNFECVRTPRKEESVFTAKSFTSPAESKEEARQEFIGQFEALSEKLDETSEPPKRMTLCCKLAWAALLILAIFSCILIYKVCCQKKEREPGLFMYSYNEDILVSQV